MFKNSIIVKFALVFCSCVLCGSVYSNDNRPPEIVEVFKIWDKAPHSAFTDLIRFKGNWYCTFREADSHAGGQNGKIRVVVSEDGNKWSSSALLTEEGVDLRDPKLSITPDGRLMLLMGGSVYEGKKLISRQPRVAFSKDGCNWTATQKILSEGDWLWRVTWHEAKAYGVSYRTEPKEDWTLTLFVSKDGLKYDKVCKLNVPGNANETTLRFLPSGEMTALVRREGGSKKAWIGVSEAPYKKWTWKETKHQIGGPNFIILPDGKMYAGGRNYIDKVSTMIGPLTPDGYEPIFTLPSGGDTSYPGMVWHENLLWVSYYSSHEGKASIYLAKIKLSQ
jgi:hypothetical protein